LATSHLAGSLATVEVVSSWTTHHSAATTARAAGTTSRWTTCAGSTAGTTTARDLFFDSDFFIGLSDDHRNTLSILHALGETLALALIKRPGSGEVWRSSLRSQSKHQRACQAKSVKQLSHSRSP